MQRTARIAAQIKKEIRFILFFWAAIPAFGCIFLFCFAPQKGCRLYPGCGKTLLTFYRKSVYSYITKGEIIVQFDILKMRINF
ncbi:hypothetical protein CHX27_13410 [Flavobacterium aurantiibacter]|uniref:Uncharacterized protein n=1 Tax=Flavobacterium aurantiibacter TaxID=2023067 RepID=A0A255ZGV9_9FLAO|nr:hypothetical protein CHX27_13410 [Flavobacterium aurantiibacter]